MKDHLFSNIKEVKENLRKTSTDLIYIYLQLTRQGMRELRYVQSCRALLIQLQISVFLFLFPLFLLSRNCGPRVSVQLHTTQFSMGSFSICSIKGCYYTLTCKLELPVNTPSFLLLPPLRSVKRAAYIYLTHICVSLSWCIWVCVCIQHMCVCL